jgi:hypothetical protein
MAGQDSLFDDTNPPLPSSQPPIPPPPIVDRYFKDYQEDATKWITLASGDYYPDILEPACRLYRPVLETFNSLLESSESSERLLIQIMDTSNQWMRIQLARVFRKYVSPGTPVEMIKRKNKVKKMIEDFGDGFRPITEVHSAFKSRPMPDEALCALLWEYKDRGKKGYDLTERFFDLVRPKFTDFRIIGPERAGRDVLMKEVFADFPTPDKPVDFVISENSTGEVLAIGLARYDSDRGGAQEDDRTGNYRSSIDEILAYASAHHLKTKVILLNDGPGLLLGSMWRDYVRLEESYHGKVMVATLRMLPERLTVEWLRRS